MAKNRRKKNSLPDYERPPVIEVVYGVRFTPLKDWALPHIGAFWQRVAEEFPRCEHAPPIGDPLVIDPAVGAPLPRVWLINVSDDRLIQLQPGRFLFNWRHREDVGSYPHYPDLSKEFFTLFRQFREFAAEHKLEDIEVVDFELTYINHIPEQEGWGFPEQLGRVIGQLEWHDSRYRFLPRPSAINWQARFPFKEHQGELVVKLKPVRRTKDDKPLLVLEMSTRGQPAEAAIDDVAHWFSHAHEWIVRGFEDLTSDEAQKELWGKHERR
jgi:uncharacterized protein (TIGR04255 family)